VPATPAIDVYCAREPAGTLARSDIHAGEFLFEYASSCPKKNAVSLTMPVVRDQYDSMNTVPPIFEMNLPEGALLEKLRLRFAKAIPNFDDLHLLEIVGQSQIGRLRYARTGTELSLPTCEPCRHGGTPTANFPVRGSTYAPSCPCVWRSDRNPIPFKEGWVRKRMRQGGFACFER
jgi:HipA-like protein